MSVETESNRDPRVRLIREKYFSIRPRPLERWLWSRGIPASAERVFWLHWQEGVQRGDWCSEIPLKRVARECSLDVSTVTRAYQLLAKMGCIRRTDPGRDAANPFQQATALTEVRLPRELLTELDSHPNRRTKAPPNAQRIEVQRAPDEDVTPQPAATQESASPDPLAGLRGRDRVRMLSELTRAMSEAERGDYQTSMRLHRASMNFDRDSKLTEEARAVVQQMLASMAQSPAAPGHMPSATAPRDDSKGRRKLAVFEVARLKRGIQIASSSTVTSELLRQVIWSIELGALKRFNPLHAAHIALKKIREGTWTRPHRMPPNWCPEFLERAVTETCRAA